MKPKKARIVFDNKINCPHCNKRIIVRHEKRQLKEAVAAEYEEKTIVEKDAQKTLHESTKKSKLPKMKGAKEFVETKMSRGDPSTQPDMGITSIRARG